MSCGSTSCLVVRCSPVTVVVSFKTSTESRIITSVTHLISFVMPFTGVTTPFITVRGPSSPCFSTVFTIPLPLENPFPNAGVWPVGSDGELNEVAEIPWLAAGEKKWKSEHCWHVMCMVNKWVFSPTYKWDILGIILGYLWIQVRFKEGWLHSLKLTVRHWKEAVVKRKLVFQPSIFNEYVSYLGS